MNIIQAVIFISIVVIMTPFQFQIVKLWISSNKDVINVIKVGLLIKISNA